MLQNPLTPPNEDSHQAFDIDNGAALSPSQPFATPMSLASIDFESLDESMGLEDLPDHPDISDEDQDMSDGGAALTMTLSHAEELNAEMDLLDAEVMGPDNLVGLYSVYTDSVPSPDQYSQDPTDPIDETMDDADIHESANTSYLPTSMSAVSQQLQHIQDGQAHEESAEAADELHGAFMNNSTSSIHFPSTPFVESSNILVGAGAEYVSLADIPSVDNTLAPFGPPMIQDALPLWSSTEGTAGSSALDAIVPPQPQQFASHFATVDFTLDDVSEADQTEMEDQSNLSLSDFLYGWGTTSLHSEDSKRPHRGPDLPELYKQRAETLNPLSRADLQGERCDIQRLNWEELGVSRLEARQMRRQTYRNYTNLRISPQWHPRLNGTRLAEDQNFFRFRRMNFSHKIHLSHFQLRNLLACASRDHVFYAGRSKILQWNPTSGPKFKNPTVAMDLTEPTVQAYHAYTGGIQISTLTTAHNVLVAGGFCGEYSLVNLRAPKTTKHTEGLITYNENGITNHVQVHLSRNSSLPLAAFASNDNSMRILDINTNKFIAEHKYDHAINCSAISPDQRLRVLVGDTRQVMICNSETGEILQSLDGHRDYGFACDWADDGWTVATGNQDMQVKIWDARKWTSSQGLPSPVSTVPAEMAGVRKLKFSPLGSGKRVLLAAEPADFISVIDAQTFTSKQTLNFFGEIGGLDFTNEGQDFIVANCDGMRGGLMEFERSDLARAGLYNLEESQQDRSRSQHRRKGEGYDWKSADEDILSHQKSRGTKEQRWRKPAALGITMDYF